MTSILLVVCQDQHFLLLLILKSCYVFDDIVNWVFIISIFFWFSKFESCMQCIVWYSFREVVSTCTNHLYLCCKTIFYHFLWFTRYRV